MEMKLKKEIERWQKEDEERKANKYSLNDISEEDSMDFVESADRMAQSAPADITSISSSSKSSRRNSRAKNAQIVEELQIEVLVPAKNMVNEKTQLIDDTQDISTQMSTTIAATESNTE